MELLRQRSELSMSKEMSLIIKERDELKEEVQALMEYYLKTKEVNRSEKLIMQANKNNQLLNETDDVLKSASEALADGLKERQEMPRDTSLSERMSSEIERQCNFLRKAMREIYSPTTNALIQTFGSPENIVQLQATKDYENLLVSALKVVGKMIVVENSANPKLEPYPEGKSSNEDKLSDMKSEKSAQLNFLNNKEDNNRSETEYGNPLQRPKESDVQHANSGNEFPMSQKVERSPDRNEERKRMYLAMSQGSVWRSFSKAKREKSAANAEMKPAFNNYTKRTTDYFDPFLQFGGESL
eukprot:TRINITY_DN8133_c0_g1_i2.p2 TRINITY_DN8133_c0_g1~~TRINITY_DN8133_c0_g1_i2.p2  ORF type:complete len:299 (-),score=58.75 TRINITY_DN8133_c0_g1_i2:345-1241(-)